MVHLLLKQVCMYEVFLEWEIPQKPGKALNTQMLYSGLVLGDSGGTPMTSETS